MIDCHSNPSADCYGVYSEDNSSYNLRVLYHYYMNRIDTLRPVPDYLKKKLTKEESQRLNRILNGSNGIKIKNHSIVKYKETSVGAYTVFLDSIDKKVLVNPRIIKPISN